ncbi:MAG: deoxyribose-phosphate aldolase [Candidatus Geothermincolia bacterium]
MPEDERDCGAARGGPVDPGSLSVEELSQMIDFTLLKPEKSIQEYSAFIVTAKKYGFRTVFLPPCYAPLAVGMLGATNIHIGVPISFPFGYATPEVKVAEAVTALDEGAHELDVVLNVSAAVSNEWDIVEEDLVAVVSAVRDWERMTLKGPVTVKLILETPYLSEGQKREACHKAMVAGMDFVKTATGLGPGGATVEDIRLMRSVVGDELGVKAAGGIRTWSDARAMIEAGANRIGTSAGPEIIEDFLRAGK